MSGGFFLRFLFVLGFFLGMFPSVAFSSESGYTGKVVQINIGEEDLSNSQSFKFMERVLKRAGEEGAKGVVLNMNTPGGLAWETSELMMRVLQPMKVPTYAYVNPKAMSAGALIAASCDEIYMAPGSAIGAAALVASTGQEIEPIMRKKMESAFGAFTRSVVTEKGHNPALIKAMMVPSETEVKFGSVVVPKGDLLTLTAREAVEVVDGKPLLAKGIAASVQEVIALAGNGAPVIVAEATGFEKIAWWLAWMSPLLILIGIGGIYFEFKTPGFGIGGVVAIAAFSLFFFGNNVAGNLAGYETAALFVAGIVFVCVEIFVLPGLIVFGVLGAICLIAGLFFGMVDLVDMQVLFSPGGFTLDNVVQLTSWPLIALSLGLAGSVALIALMMRYLPNFVLLRSLTNADVSGGTSAPLTTAVRAAVAAGDTGVALTELKPSGKAEFNGNYYDVSCRDGLLEKGSRIRAVQVGAFQIIVEGVEPEGAGRE